MTTPDIITEMAGMDKDMTGFKYTQGPWRVCGNGDCSCKTVSASDHPICKVTSGDWGDSYPSVRIVGHSFSLDRKAEAYMEQITYGCVDEDVAKGNALLIAASPDLFEALKALLVISDPNTNEFVKARAVVAKVEAAS
ncbi:MAG: hypothetical protein KGL39_57415 [Patescibacteria group bacterium]|nr:hypothetical protein [Patescibacteria group bacterium]